MSGPTWWKQWGELIRKLLALCASFASMVSLFVAFLPSPRDLPWWAVVLLVTAIFFLILLVVSLFLDRRGRRVYEKADTEGIRRYMHDWIEHGGRVAIWTRDMSWAQNRETRSLLTEKAKRHELILCLPKLDNLVKKLEAAGAEVSRTDQSTSNHRHHGDGRAEVPRR